MFGEDLLITICGIILIVLFLLIFALPIIIVEYRIKKIKKQNPNYTDMDAFNDYFKS